MKAASEYLQSYGDYFWRYEDQGKVIAVPDGRTLGYADQVINEIVFQLAPHGLPRFGSLMLAIAATTARGSDTLADIMEIVEAKAERNESIEKGLEFAKLLTQVPAKFKKGNLRILLFQAVFMRSHNGVGEKKSKQILMELKTVSSIRQYTTAWSKRPLTDLQLTKILIDDFKTLAIIGRELTDVPIILKRIAGLPSVTHALEALEPELEPVQGAAERTLVDELLEHHETFHVGVLVAGLISGLQISFHASLPSEQPLGGVADITNKGSFDKLLTSEYAFDDHVLLSRLANSEALYKHREVPPADNTYPRVLLIDTTLKNWGTIRTVSFATALAIAEHPKNRQPCRVFLVGESYQEITVATVTDVIDGLNTLDSSLDPGIGIGDLFASEDLKASELFFLGTEASLTSPGMLRISVDPGRRIDHWIHPDEQGGLKVYKNPKRGKRFVQELKLPLDELWSKPKNRKNEVATISTTDYPILFPEMRMKATWRDHQFTYGLAKDRALMRLYADQLSPIYGWELVSGTTRSVDHLKAVITNDDLSVTVLFATDAKEFTVVNYPGGERFTVAADRRLAKLRGKDFYVEDGCFKVNVQEATVCIDVQGRVSKQGLTKDRRVSKKPFQNRTSNFFRQIKRVSISADNHLRFRKHDLIIENDRFYLRHRARLKVDVKVKADEEAPGTFTFPDGSSVVHNPNGMLTLKSADPALLDIHLPTQLDVSVGLATVDTFAGQTYFQKKPLIEVIVNDGIGHEFQLASLISQSFDKVNLQRAEKMAKSGLIICPDEASLAKLESAMAGFSYRVRRRGLQQLEMAPSTFYDQYIQPFITHIVNHGTNA